MIPTNISILIFCIFVLALLLQSAYVPLRGDGSRACFAKIVIVAICSCLFYLTSTLCDNHRELVVVNRILNGFYFSLTAILPMMWIIYIGKAIKAFRPEHRVLYNIVCLPMVVLAVLSLISIGTGWNFEVDEVGVYHRGVLYFPYTIVVAMYVVVPMVFTLWRAVDKRYYAERAKYLSLASYGFFALWGIVAEIIFAGVPASVMGIVFSLLMNHLSYQRSRISTDSLTGLNNRNKLNSYMSIAMENIPEDKKLFLLVFDMDKFNRINEKFGFKNGDKALILFSVVLKRVCGPKGFFISRYGADEFTVVAKCDNEQECIALISEIKIALANASRRFVCSLSVSVGYAETVENDNIPDMFSRANRMLFAEKTHCV